jgi:hypothetical protein
MLMSKELYIYHHLGLGDHIICNAIVRNYAKENDKVYLFVKPNNINNVRFMYRDLNNIDYIVGDDRYAEDYIRNNNIKNILKIGFDKLDRTIKFDESFYKSIGMNFEKKWNDFYIERDINSEKNLFNGLGISENNYIFISEDTNRGYKLDYNKYPHDVKIISSEMNCGLFDLCYTIENAREIHVMESSIKSLIEHLDVKTNKLYLHDYVRNYNNELHPTSKKEWLIIS